MDVYSSRRTLKGIGMGITVAVVAAVLLAATTPSAMAGRTECVSLNSRDRLEIGECPAISADGRYVAFRSAGRLVAADNNRCYDVFVRDRQTGETTRVSVASNGTEGNSWSDQPAISADGRYVAFRSRAWNLTPGHEWIWEHIYVHDLATRQTICVSVSSSEELGDGNSWAPSISADGRYVIFRSYAHNLAPCGGGGVANVFVRDRQTGQTMCVGVDTWAPPQNPPYIPDSIWVKGPSITGDGRYAAFEARGGLMPGDPRRSRWDVFVHDLHIGQTIRVSVASNGEQADHNSDDPSISADGRYVAFESQAGNLAPGDTNEKPDIFVHDRQTGQTTRVSVASDGMQADEASYLPCISGDGSCVAFMSAASNLVPGDTNGKPDIFVHDRRTGQTTCVSVDCDGTQGDDSAYAPSISADGRYVAFSSGATNLVPWNTSGAPEAFVHDRDPEPPQEVTVALSPGWSQPSCGRPFFEHASLEDLLGPDVLSLWLWHASEFRYGPPESLHVGPAYYAGQGMWALSATHASRTVAVRDPTALDVSVSPGWNLLANPFAKAVDLQTGLLPEGDGQIYVPGYHWNPERFAYDQASVMSAGWSFWVLADYEGVATFDPAGVTTPAECAEVASLAAAAEIPDNSRCIQLVAEAGDSRDRSVWLGTTSGDVLLTPKPPVAPNAVGAHIDVSDGIGYARSIVPEGQEHVWTLTVNSPIDEATSLRVVDTSQLPGDMAVWLTDRATGTRIDLRHAPGYSHTAREGQRRFDIELGERDRLLQVTSVSVRPAGGGSQITLTLSAAGSVTVDVLNIAGRVVRRIVADRECDAGLQTVSWNGRSDSGTQVPDGIYLIRVKAAARTGEQCQALSTLRIR
ncbi:MAG: FlgD immunoglobulin-like domain containing protein [Armatimonadota bacterium]|nr:FlgD immunoglobulin-like domain containing protein [Armatimonadota bacterium]